MRLIYDRNKQHANDPDRVTFITFYIIGHDCYSWNKLHQTRSYHTYSDCPEQLIRRVKRVSQADVT